MFMLGNSLEQKICTRPKSIEARHLFDVRAIIKTFQNISFYIGLRAIFGSVAVNHLPKNSRKLPKFLRNSGKKRGSYDALT